MSDSITTLLPLKHQKKMSQVAAFSSLSQRTDEFFMYFPYVCIVLE